MEFPMEIAHVEEIEEHIVEQDGTEIPDESRDRKSAPANQKIVLVQTPQGVTRAVRVQGSQQTFSTGASGGGPIQYVKTGAGLVQVRNATPTQSVHRVASSAGGNSGARSTPGNKAYVVAKPAVKQATPQTVTKTITMAQAQQMGLLTAAGAPAAGKVITLNAKTRPVVAATPPTKVVKQAASDSPRIIQISPGVQSQGRMVVAAPKAVQYIEVVARPNYPAKKEPQTVTVINKRTTVVKQEEQQKVKVSTQTADKLSQLEGSVVIPGLNQSKVVMLPADYMDQMVTKQAQEEQDDDEGQPHDEDTVAEMVEVVNENDLIVQSVSPTPTDMMVDLAPKKRPCNCTKSQCLKLYCECFANGEFCSDCNCKDCFNTLDHEEERQAAIYTCLERNPNAFRPKIGKVSTATVGLRHHKGCHCKRSGCLKNYCECFEAKIPCSEMCKCVDCKNSDEHAGSVHYFGSGKTVSAIKRAVAAVDGDLRPKTNEDDEPPPKQPYNFMTPDVVDATVQCMMAQADECQQNGVSYRNTERLILEEFGRCLAEIIDFSTKNTEAE